MADGAATEAIIDPDRPIIDPHHHLMMNDRFHYLMPELLADVTAGHKVIATVHVEVSEMHSLDVPPEFAPVGLTEYCAGVAAMAASGKFGATRLCAGIVGRADLMLGARVRPVLEAHIRAGAGRFRGIRYSAPCHEDPRLRVFGPERPARTLYDPVFREGFAELAPLGLSFDTFASFLQLHEIADLARAFPNTSIILNHIGMPLGIGPYEGKRDEVFAAWSKALAAVATCPNVTVKLGGLGMRAHGFQFRESELPVSSEVIAAAWRPYFDKVIELFGAGRSMLESNFPVDAVACDYVTLWNAFKRLAAGCSEDEKTALFQGTAANAYRLPAMLHPGGAGPTALTGTAILTYVP